MTGFTEQGTVGALQPPGRLVLHCIAVDPAEASLQSDKAKILKSKEYTRFCGCKMNFKRVYFSFPSQSDNRHLGLAGGKAGNNNPNVKDL